MPNNLPQRALLLQFCFNPGDCYSGSLSGIVRPRPVFENVMKASAHILLLLFLAAAVRWRCQGGDALPASLASARQSIHTQLQSQQTEKTPVETAPAKVFLTIKYPAASGQLAAYVTPDPGDGKKHPAILWITGGDCNSISDVWSPAARENDQTAAAYRKAGIVMMFPSLRGGNDNPGVKEGFLGEVDDVVAAAKDLQKRPYVDPARVYLGGHSTGGTLALLVSECSPLFRAVFAFGPVANVAGYGRASGLVPVDLDNRKEVMVRSPVYWLDCIQSPTWVLEGTDGNIGELRAMNKQCSNAKVRFVEIKGADHFGTLAPINELIARQILHDSGGPCNITLPAEEVNRQFAASQTAKQ
jgi:acetyl esterase/lipase